MRQESRGAHYRSDFPKIDDESQQVNIYCRKEGKGVSRCRPAEEMVLFKQNVKEIKGLIADFLKSHVKATIIVHLNSNNKIIKKDCGLISNIHPRHLCCNN